MIANESAEWQKLMSHVDCEHDSSGEYAKPKDEKE
jgi:hypothetical protein